VGLSLVLIFLEASVRYEETFKYYYYNTLNHNSGDCKICEAEIEDFEMVFYKFFSCGCGRPEEARELLHKTLRIYAIDWDTLELRGTSRWALLHELLDCKHEGMFWSYLNIFDHAELTDHGGNIQSGWLTLKGDRVLQYLDAEYEFFDKGYL
jgi:hypothetical protein